MVLIVIISLIIYIIGAIAIYHNMYSIDKAKKIRFIVIGFIIVLIITIVLVSVSSNNIEIQNKEYKSYEPYINTTKTMSILLFAPINSIISLVYIANILNKYTDKRIDENKLTKRFLIFGIILILVIIFEIGYITDFETGLITNALKANNI